MNDLATNTAARKSKTGRWRTIFLTGSIILLVGILPVRWYLFEIDHAFANLTAFPIALGAAFLALLWFATGHGLSRNQRAAIVVSPLLLGIVGLGLFRFEGFTGEMAPTFRFRWVTRGEIPRIAKGEYIVDLPNSPLAEKFDFNTISFPQFLGPDRNGKIPNLSLDPGWDVHPPEILWKQSIGAGWAGFAIQGRRAVTLEQRERSEVITCYDILTGKMLWQRAYPASHSRPEGGAGPRSTPSIANGFVYTQGATGVVNCVNLLNGAPQWTQSFIGESPEQVEQKMAERDVQWGRSGSPLVHGGGIYLPIGGGKEHRGRSLAMLDAGLGKVLWRKGEDQISYASPALLTIDGVQQIVCVNESTVTGHATDDGAVLWSFPWPGQSNGAASVSQPVQINSNQLLLSKGYAQGVAVINIARSGDGQHKAELVWQDFKLLKTKFTSTVVADGFAYGISDGILECVDLNSHQRKWKQGRYGQGQLLMVGKWLLITAEDGNVVLVEANPAGFKEVARLKVLDDTTWNNPALAGPFLLVRNAKEAACLRLPIFESPAE